MFSLELPDDKLDALFTRYDVNSSGYIEMDDFVKCGLVPKIPCSLTMAEDKPGFCSTMGFPVPEMMKMPVAQVGRMEQLILQKILNGVKDSRVVSVNTTFRYFVPPNAKAKDGINLEMFNHTVCVVWCSVTPDGGNININRIHEK